MVATSTAPVAGSPPAAGAGSPPPTTAAKTAAMAAPPSLPPSPPPSLPTPSPPLPQQSLLDLPSDATEAVLEALPPADLPAVAASCTRLSAMLATANAATWGYLLRSHFGVSPPPDAAAATADAAGGAAAAAPAPPCPAWWLYAHHAAFAGTVTLGKRLTVTGALTDWTAGVGARPNEYDQGVGVHLLVSGAPRWSWAATFVYIDEPFLVPAAALVPGKNVVHATLRRDHGGAYYCIEAVRVAAATPVTVADAVGNLRANLS
ncbi:hypothetical protein I4F81_005977 [Pyropia yezoensis]|uniref:Uncharacterized protein n=1 Tax=Pyropia yezoensis TaxID=2788 RepID=A0ACC3C0X7_PYRYE|nr:hypothetical protein I4F81_005977 [Neopyropia yezoensis]